MRKVEAVRLRLGISKTALAGKLETTTDALRAWMTGRTLVRKETVAKITDFLIQTLSRNALSAPRQALGHNSKAVHRAYAKRALMNIPSLEDYERKAAGAAMEKAS